MQRDDGAGERVAMSGDLNQLPEEKHVENPNLYALDLILAAWDEGVDNGVSPQQMAYAAMFTALTDLVAIYGEDAVIRLTKGLEKRLTEGEFTLARRDQ